MAIRKNKPGVSDGIKYADGAGTEEHDGIKYPEEHRTYDELATGGRAMARGQHGPHEAEHGDGHHTRHHGDGHVINIGRKAGGKVKARAASGRTGRSDEQGEEGSGKPEFFAGAESPTAKAAHGDEKAKKGGRIKKRRERAHGGRMHVEGKDGHKRLDRAAGGRARRASGGMVGSDKHPLTEANRLTAPKGDRREPADNPEDD